MYMYFELTDVNDIWKCTSYFSGKFSDILYGILLYIFKLLIFIAYILYNKYVIQMLTKTYSLLCEYVEHCNLRQSSMSFVQ